eukprot:144983-Prymnesium_polylepis.1
MPCGSQSVAATDCGPPHVDEWVSGGRAQQQRGSRRERERPIPTYRMWIGPAPATGAAAACGCERYMRVRAREGAGRRRGASEFAWAMRAQRGATRTAARGCCGDIAGVHVWLKGADEWPLPYQSVR